MQDPSLLAMVIGLFAMTGPIAGLPLFVAATKGQTIKEQRKTIFLIATTYVIAGFIALFAGNMLLRFFGISVAALRIAGMSIIATIGWKMLNAPTVIEDNKKPAPRKDQNAPDAKTLHHAASNTNISETSHLQNHVATPSEVGIMPLGFPLYAGPGVLSVIISWSSGSMHIYMTACGAILINAALIIILDFLAQPITRLIGAQGLLITEKVFGLIVLAIAVVGISDALLVLFPGLGRAG